MSFSQIHLYSDGGLDISHDGNHLLTCSLLFTPPSTSPGWSLPNLYTDRPAHTLSPLSHTERASSDSLGVRSSISSTLPNTSGVIVPINANLENGVNTQSTLSRMAGVHFAHSRSQDQIFPDALLGSGTHSHALSSYNRIASTNTALLTNISNIQNDGSNTESAMEMDEDKNRGNMFNLSDINSAHSSGKSNGWRHREADFTNGNTQVSGNKLERPRRQNGDQSTTRTPVGTEHPLYDSSLAEVKNIQPLRTFVDPRAAHNGQLPTGTGCLNLIFRGDIFLLSC